MSHDRKCYALAAHFLTGHESATEAHIHALAEVIQQAIEDWLESPEGPEDINEDD